MQHLALLTDLTFKQYTQNQISGISPYPSESFFGKAGVGQGVPLQKCVC